MTQQITGLYINILGKVFNKQLFVYNIYSVLLRNPKYHIFCFDNFSGVRLTYIDQVTTQFC